MNPDPRSPDGSSVDDKLELHHRLQLSALVDGELAPDQARFLLRRLEHDAGLRGRFERWQLGGDVLRGQVRRAAAPELGARIAAAIAAEPATASLPMRAQAGTRRQAWTRWGGGTALAASLAALAMFVARPVATDPSQGPVAVPAAVAMQAQPATGDLPATVAAPMAVARQAPQARPQPVPARHSPASPMVASNRAARAPAALPVGVTDAVADTATAPAAATNASDPFASATPLQSKPWPRAMLAQPEGNVYTARFGEPAASTSFYPFEPSLPAPVDAPSHGPQHDRPDDAPASLERQH